MVTTESVRAPLPRKLPVALRRVAVRFALVIYSIAIFLALDWVYSGFLHDDGASARRPHWAYNHGLTPNFDGYDSWGEHRYRFITNSLGFRDSEVRNVSATPGTRRVLLIGDSFTEGVGVEFEDTFAGKLNHAGMQRAERIEFLDAAVVSYSPTLYYKKIKYFMERGLRFDEVVVFSDVSDVFDEATKYYCQDDDPQYRKYCTEHEIWFYGALCRPDGDGGQERGKCLDGDGLYALRQGFGPYMARHFAVSDTMRTMIKFRLQEVLGNRKRSQLTVTPVTAWLFADPRFERDYAPVGMEGGIARSLANMQNLADLLKSNNIPLTVVVYPWPIELGRGDRDSRQVAIWREFCAKNCKEFINLFPTFFADADAREDWYERLFISGDFHFSREGHDLMFRALASHLL
jgi:lysophospholipase L1-like esterase